MLLFWVSPQDCKLEKQTTQKVNVERKEKLRTTEAEIKFQFHLWPFSKGWFQCFYTWALLHISGSEWLSCTKRIGIGPVDHLSRKSWKAVNVSLRVIVPIECPLKEFVFVIVIIIEIDLFLKGWDDLLTHISTVVFWACHWLKQVLLVDRLLTVHSVPQRLCCSTFNRVRVRCRNTRMSL